jgi:5'-nucleotidase
MNPTRFLAAAGLAAAAAMLPLSGQAHRRPLKSQPFTVKIIGLNDYHGHLQSPGTMGQNTSVPIAQRPPVGGADFLAGHVARLKARNPLNVVVGAGDFIGATPLISSLFFDEPSVEVLNRIGLEFNAVGNHEFDKGAGELLRLQRGGCRAVPGGGVDPNSCKGAAVGTPFPFEGARFRWLAANVVSRQTGRTLLPAYGIKSFKGVRMAFIGMTLKGTPTIVTPTGVAGLDFRDEADTVNALVPRLRREGVKAIVVLVHEGGAQRGPLQDINGCEGDLAGSAIAGIVARLHDAVDLVVSGHTHAAYNCRLPNVAGRAIPVTSASSFGRVLSDIDVTLDPLTRDVSAVNATNRLVDRSDATVTPDPAVLGIVNAYATLLAPIANQVIGSISADLPGAAGADSACNMAAGELIADAQLAATAPAGFGEAVIAFMNRGGVRAGFALAGSPADEGEGNVTYGEAFTAQPFGNSLVTMTLTAQQIKDALEQQFAGCRGQSVNATRLMIPSAGFRYTWDGSRACDARISHVTLTTNGVTQILVDAVGTVLEPGRTYRVTVNNFMATGGDGFTTFVGGAHLLGGAQDIDALTAYFAGFKAPQPPYDPARPGLGKPRIQRVGALSATAVCPHDSNVNP